MSLLSAGDRIGEALVVDRLLGEGAFAEAYRVDHAYLGRQAMKLFKQVTSAEETHALLGEARLLSTLGHPHIIRIFDAGTVRTARGLRGYFTMEYVPGGTLHRFVTGHTPALPTALATAVTAQIAAGLAVAHDQDPPILHRDLTMDNILVGYDGAGLRIRISDFGLVRHADPFTGLASAQGTYAFMAPEVLRDMGYSCASDVWSVGVIAYLMLTGRLPFDDGGEFAPLRLARFRRPLLPPSSYNETVDAALDGIVMATLQVDPWRRTAKAGDLATALRLREEQPAGPAVWPAPSAHAEELLRQAQALSRTPGKLLIAADLLEEAVSLSPRLRERHLDTLLLWRRGVLM
ncbi:serine/threonine-protein kinase [Catenuloplanes japonicus]|uniref:serine/threonine-protein kinase n=1 Tax=Catenuloplanes japonicus TaxID=33876 RepID=UPI0005250573|nr:serine/threonine-protein kinase [Catenuloplanes japonicus]